MKNEIKVKGMFDTEMIGAKFQVNEKTVGEVVGKIGSGHGLVFSPSAFESDTEHRIDAMSLVELMIEGEQGL